MFRIFVGLAMLIVAIVLFGFAGGIDVWSAADWQHVAQKWSLPTPAQNERCFALLVGILAIILSGARFITPRHG
jgi:hypothetical protein